MGGVAERVVLAGIVTGASAVISIANLAGSIRVLDLTGSVFMLSLSVLLYNVAFTIMSWVWPAIFLGRVSRRGMLAFALGGMAAGLALMGIPPVPALVVAGSGVVGVSSALVSPVMMTIMADYYGKDSLAVTKYNTYSSVGFVLGYVAAALIRMRVGTPRATHGFRRHLSGPRRPNGPDTSEVRHSGTKTRHVYLVNTSAHR